MDITSYAYEIRKLLRIYNNTRLLEKKKNKQDLTDLYFHIFKVYNKKELEMTTWAININNAVNSFCDFYNDQQDHSGKRQKWLMASNIINLCLPEIIYLVNGDDSNQLEHMKINEFLRIYESNHPMNWSSVANLFLHKNYMQICDLYCFKATINHLRNVLKVDGSTKIAYYTSMQTFSYLLPEHDSLSNCARLSLMNISYMNDSREGKVLKELLGLSTHRGNNRESLIVPPVFLKCFSRNIDFLPMWQTYGDAAKGVCIILDTHKVKVFNHGIDVDFYKVCYLNQPHRNSQPSVDNKYNIFNEDEKQCIERDLASLKIIKRKSGFINEELCDSLIGDIAYLFKDASYSYEQEIRIIDHEPSLNSDNVIETSSGDPKKLYVLSQFLLQIDEIIIGPKCEDVYELIPYFQKKVEKMCKLSGSVMPKITLSNINYR